MSSGDPEVLARIEAVAVELAEAAGRLLRGRYRSALQVEFKGRGRHDPVTEVDRAVEQLVRDAIGQAFPDHAVIGEETEAAELPAEFAWVVDPVDGTANFVDGLPAFAASIGVLHRGMPVAGAVYLPVTPGLRSGIIHARRGSGAWIDGEQLTLARDGGSESRLCALPPAFGWQFQVKPGFRRVVGEVRSLGSVVYEIALVSSGTLRFAIFRAPKLWDVAAGAAILPEAGGAIVAWDGRGWQPLTVFRPRPASRWGRWPFGKPRPAGLLRSWSAPVLVGHPDAVRAVAGSVRPRGGWLLKLLRLLRR